MHARMLMCVHHHLHFMYQVETYVNGFERILQNISFFLNFANFQIMNQFHNKKENNLHKCTVLIARE